MGAGRLYFTAVLAAATLPLATASAEAQRLAFCSGPVGSLQAQAVEEISQGTEADKLAVRAVETSGSLNNLARLARGDCGAAVVRLDALMIYAMEAAGRRIKIAPPIHLFDERLYMICRREAGIDSVADLLRAPENFTVLTGRAGSGSETTWQALTGLDMELPKVGTRALGGGTALAALLSGDTADCMTILAAANGRSLGLVEPHGDRLALVSVDLFDFRDPEMVYDRIYKSVSIPAGTHGALQAELIDPEVETISVGTIVIVSKAWTLAQPEAYRYLRRAISKVKPRIAAAFSQ